jgi:hypothetical protein
MKKDFFKFEIGELYIWQNQNASYGQLLYHCVGYDNLKFTYTLLSMSTGRKFDYYVTGSESLYFTKVI